MQTRLVSEARYNSMMEKSFLYDSQVEPIIHKLDTEIKVLRSVCGGLVVGIVVLFVLYRSERSMKLYLKECLDLNFGWFRKGN